MKDEPLTDDQQRIVLALNQLKEATLQAIQELQEISLLKKDE